MNRQILPVILLAIIFLFGCGKASPVPDEITDQVDTQSITSTNLNGNSLGQVDPTDWTKDVNWMATESALLETPTATQLSNIVDTGTVSVFVAFPNPMVSQFNWGFKTTKPALLQMVIVDNLLKVKWRQYFTTQTGSNVISILMPDADYLNNKNYRLYYAFYCSSKGLYYKGHGDLAVRK